MSLFFVSLLLSSLSIQLCVTDTKSPTSAPIIYKKDCCERTTGLLYDAIDCYDDNTPIIIKEAQQYLFDPSHDCKNTTHCSFSDDSSAKSILLSRNYPTSKCLISWALLQQYYNKCPEIVMTTTDAQQTVSYLPESDNLQEQDISHITNDENETVNFEAAPKYINPLIYESFITEETCGACYGQYNDDKHGECNGFNGLCDLEYDECGVCSLVICLGNINNNDYVTNKYLYGMGALAIWQRALLLSSVVVLGCICCWGLCYVLSCNRPNSFMNRMFTNNLNNNNNNNNNNAVQIASDDSDD